MVWHLKDFFRAPGYYLWPLRSCCSEASGVGWVHFSRAACCSGRRGRAGTLAPSVVSVSPFWHVLRSGDVKSILQVEKITTMITWRQEAKENKLCDSQCCCLQSFVLLALALTTLLALSPLSYIQAAINSCSLFTSTQFYHTCLPMFAFPNLSSPAQWPSSHCSVGVVDIFGWLFNFTLFP